MKKKLLFIFAVILSMPNIVYALTLECPTGPFTFNNTFECRLKDDSIKSYKNLKAIVHSKTGLDCVISKTEEGISNTSQANNVLSIEGTSTSEYLATLQCFVNIKPEVQIQSTVMLEKLNYELEDGKKEENLVVRSDFVNVDPYVEEPDTKPRDTSNPASLLSNVTISNAEFIFSKLILKYNIQVLNEVTTLEIATTPNDEAAIVNIQQPEELVEGINVIDIYVTSPDGVSTTCYTFNIKRLAAGESIYYEEKDAALKDLIIKGKTINFSSTEYEYTIHLESNEDSLEIDAISNSTAAIVEISRNNNLKNNDVITITVTSPDGTEEKIYKIKIQKEEEKKNYKTYYILGGAGALIFIIIILIIVNNSKNKKDPLMKLKKEEKKKNKGNKTNENDIPISDNSTENQVEPNVTQNVVPNDNLAENTPIPVETPSGVTPTENVEQPVQTVIKQVTINTGINNVNQVPVEQAEPNVAIPNQEAIIQNPEIAIPEPLNNVEAPVFNNNEVAPMMPTQELPVEPISQPIPVNNDINQMDNTVVINGNQENILPVTPNEPKLPGDQKE